MRRDRFLRTLAALSLGAGLSPWARAAVNLKMMIPANPGGGWDTTGRALGKALQDAGAAATVSYDNKGGAAGAIGLAQFVNGSKGDPNAMMVMGAVMLGGIITGKPPVQPVAGHAAGSSDQRIQRVRAAGQLAAARRMKDVVEQLKKDPGSVKWGGGSRGSTEHIAAAMIAREVGVDPAKINYVAFRGGGEATAAILGGNVTVGGSGYSEFAEYISSGKMKRASPSPPTSALQGHRRADAEGAGHQRGDRQLARRVRRAGHHGRAAQGADRHGASRPPSRKAWAEALEKNDWTPALLTGDDVRQVRRRRIRQPARHDGQVRNDLTWPAPCSDACRPRAGAPGAVRLVGAGWLSLVWRDARFRPTPATRASGPNFLPWLVAAVLAAVRRVAGAGRR